MVNESEVRALLKTIRGGNLTAARVLCDLLEEHSDDRAKELQKAIAEWDEHTGRCRTDHTKSRRWSTWDAVGSWHYHFIRRIRRIFGVRWKFGIWETEVRKLWRKNK